MIEMENEIQFIELDEGQGALLYLDLDGFKILNDTLGHHIGDEILKLVASELQLAKQSNWIMSRIDGDEFLVFIKDIESEQSVVDMAEELNKRICKTFVVADIDVAVSTSMGISIYPSHGISVDALVGNADLALQEAKRRGGSRHMLFVPKMQKDAEKVYKLINEINTALDEDEFTLFYQPQVRILDGKGVITGFEALIRWIKKDEGMVSPGDFIPVAEMSNQIVEIGRFVIKRAIEDISRINAETGSEYNMSINISGKQFKDEQLYHTLEQALIKTGIKPSLIELELTESSLISDSVDTFEIIRKLKMAGVRISIDDFGTEYSSYNYLKRMPIDKIKLDMSFVRGIGVNEKDEIILESMVELSKKMGLSVIAEGVEIVEQKDFLISKGCNDIQGYYFYRPMDYKSLFDGGVIERKPS